MSDKKNNIIKQVCKELGITQKELAERIGIPSGTVSRWASTGDIPKTARLALELLLENKELKEKLKVLALLKNTLENINIEDFS